MPVDPLLLTVGKWLGAASGVLALLMVAGFVSGWGIRFRLVGITSFTALLSLSCLAFAISYNPRVLVEGAVTAPIVFDNGTNLVVATAAADLPAEAFAPTAKQLALNLRGNGRSSPDGLVHVRLRRVESVGPGLSRPVVLAEATRNNRGEVALLQP
ncbi:Ycf51 family protein [Synechococcus sp. CS-603]|uniref:Ycf51 family protein n=1 Tax=Synechococcus sp. CS-603 TaxID=2847981 RepID=UPI00223BB69C|nr:Ycf51 family protein [Synechococcus sp. CS-603]MCT0201144.1 Ycf51 family protein [Synechococcus sp. CS-603]